MGTELLVHQRPDLGKSTGFFRKNARKCRLEPPPYKPSIVMIHDTNEARLWRSLWRLTSLSWTTAHWCGSGLGTCCSSILIGKSAERQWMVPTRWKKHRHSGLT